MTDKAVAKKAEETELILAGEETGFEDMDNAAFAVPMLRILQKLSDELDKNKGAFLPNVEEGFIYNTATKEAYSGEIGINVVIGGSMTMFVEWVPKDKGGGFAGQHDPASDVVKNAEIVKEGKKTKKLTPDGNELVETMYFSLLVQEGESYLPALFPLSSTGLGVARKWNTLQRSQVMTNGRARHRSTVLYNLKTRQTTNAKGDSWMELSPTVGRVLAPNEAHIAQQAIELGKQMVANSDKIAPEAPTKDTSTPTY